MICACMRISRYLWRGRMCCESCHSCHSHLSPSITSHLSAVNHFLTAAQQLLSSKPTINHDQSSIINPRPTLLPQLLPSKTTINHHTTHSTPVHQQSCNSCCDESCFCQHKATDTDSCCLCQYFFLLNLDCSQQFADTTYSAKR